MIFQRILGLSSKRCVQLMTSSTIRRWLSSQHKTGKEIQIPVPFIKNHIAAKLWKGNEESNKSVPIICIHGWGDNVTGFEPLAQILSVQRPNQTIVAFDMPGHAKSYHTPGIYSDLHMETLLTILRIIRHFNWEKVTILGHSYGGLIGLSFASTFPELVQHLIGIEIFHPLFLNIEGSNQMAVTHASLKGILDLESKLLSKRPAPSYSREEMVERMIQGRVRQGGLVKEGCDMFIERGAVQLPDGKYQFSHDPRSQQFFWLGRLSLSNTSAMAECLGCPTSLITCLPEIGWQELTETKRLIKNLQVNGKPFKHTKVNGSHHVHMLEPELIAPIINEFLNN